MALGGASRSMTAHVLYNDRQLQSGVRGSVQAVRSLDAAGKSTGGALGALGNQVTNLALGFGALEAARQGVQLVQLGEQAQNAERALIGLAGSEAEAARTLEGFRQATGGAVSELDATRISARLLALGIAQDSEQVRQFARDAAILGVAFGTGAAGGIENASAAIANMSIERLDTMGVSTATVRARTNELVESTAGLSREQAFAQATMEQMTVAANKLADAGVQSATGLGMLSAALADIRAGIGEGLVGSFQQSGEAAQGLGISVANLNFKQAAADAIELTIQQSGLGSALNSTSAAMEFFANLTGVARLSSQGLRGDTAQLADSLLVNSDATRTAYYETELYIGGLQRATGELYGSSQASYAAALGIDDFAGASYGAAAGADSAAGAIYNAAGALAVIAADALNAAGAVNAFNAALARQNPAAAAGNIQRQLGRLREQPFASETLRLPFGIEVNVPNPVEELRRQTEILQLENQLSGITDGMARAAEQDARSAAASIERHIGGGGGASGRGSGAAGRASSALTSAAKDAERAFEEAARKAEQAYESAFNQIRGIVSQNLDLSSSVGQFDALMDQFGLRVESTSESIRRILDVANRGGESPWVSFFGLDAFTGDELKARAAALMRDIQAGLAPQFIDEEALFVTSERALLGQRNLEGIKDRVAQRLFDAGYGAEEVARQLGQTGQTGGSELILSLVEGSRLQAQAKQEETRAIGALIGRYLNEGILGEIDGGPLIQALLDAFLSGITEAAEAA